MSKYIHRNNLVIPPHRQRKAVPEDHLKELAESIGNFGLMHAPVLRNDASTLCAGECRSAAMMFLHDKGKEFSYNGEIVPKDMIPYVTLGDLTELEVREAELEENIKRRELSVADYAAAVAELHKMRETQAAEKGEKWTAQKTAAEIVGLKNVNTFNTSREVVDNLTIAEHLHIPEVKSAKTKKEALKVVQKIKEKEHRAKLAEEFQMEIADVKFPHTVINGDTREEIRKLTPGTFDAVITDPPYGVDAHEFGSQADARHEYEDSKEYAFELYKLVAVYGKALTKPDAHLYSFLDIRYFEEISAIFRAEGWTVWPRPLIWFKGSNVGMLPVPDRGPRNTYEAILYAYKGSLTVNHVAPDVLAVQGMSRPRFGAEKPWELYHDLLARSVRPGFKVLDMFAGAGPVIPAASRLQVTATAIELNKDKCNYMLTREDKDMSTVETLLGAAANVR